MSAPIGVFDSGLGGLTVVRALRAAFPGENILYLGDTARVPYGTKSARTVERYALRCQGFLESRGIKLLVVACNTASAHGLPAMRAASKRPVIGAVVPGAQAAARVTESESVAVLATLGTVGSGAYENALAEINPDIRVSSKPCPLFVPLAEEGWGDTEIADQVAKRYLGELFESAADIDTIVLGCTHYPLLRASIARVSESLLGRSVQVVDSSEAMKDAVDALLADAKVAGSDGQERGALHCCVTDASRMEELGPRFLGEELGDIELVDL